VPAVRQSPGHVDRYHLGSPAEFLSTI